MLREMRRAPGLSQFSGTTSRPQLTISVPPGTLQGESARAVGLGLARPPIAVSNAARMQTVSLRKGVPLKTAV